MSGQLWGTDSLGGYMYTDELSDKFRMAMQPMSRWRQFCDARDASDKGLHTGDKFYWNTYSDVATQGAALAETDALPETNYTVSQNSLTVTEAGNSVH